MSFIYIVEDEESICDIERYALEKEGHSVYTFGCALDFFKALSTQKPELILLDIMLPDSNGTEILRKVRKNTETRKIPVIMVTAKSAEIDTVRALDDGADDYIKKPFSILELVSRVNAVLRRTESQKKYDTLQLDEMIIDEYRRQVILDGKTIELSYKEYELLKYLVLNTGIVLKRDTILENVWGLDCVIESRTLDAHIKQLRKKLGSYGYRIKTYRNVGYSME
jgi:two-component system alkaline phosphatase synthesis response regulator PhoP